MAAIESGDELAPGRFRPLPPAASRPLPILPSRSHSFQSTSLYSSAWAMPDIAHTHRAGTHYRHPPPQTFPTLAALTLIRCHNLLSHNRRPSHIVRFHHPNIADYNQPHHLISAVITYMNRSFHLCV